MNASYGTGEGTSGRRNMLGSFIEWNWRQIGRREECQNKRIISENFRKNKMLHRKGTIRLPVSDKAEIRGEWIKDFEHFLNLMGHQN